MTRCTGTAGEHFVAAHLLRCRLNTTPLPVDDGLDLVGHFVNEHGDSRSYLFQVKTTQRAVTSIRLTRSKFEQLQTQAVNLIVVLWANSAEPKALVLPPRLLTMMTTGAHADPNAPIRAEGSHVNIRVESHEGKVFVRNRSHDFTGMVNRFDLSEPTDIDIWALPEYACWAAAPRAVELCPDPPPRQNPNSLGGELDVPE